MKHHLTAMMATAALVAMLAGEGGAAAQNAETCLVVNNARSRAISIVVGGHSGYWTLQANTTSVLTDKSGPIRAALFFLSIYEGEGGSAGKLLEQTKPGDSGLQHTLWTFLTPQLDNDGRNLAECHGNSWLALIHD
jgi:hypothetical protein